MEGFFILLNKPMNILFVHQNFPGQYSHIIRQLAKEKSLNLVALSITPAQKLVPNTIRVIQYGIQKANTPKIHPWALETESKIIRGEACAKAANQLAQRGYVPDLICAHPGWGESLFLKEIWPNSPILHYQEFYYQSKGFDLDFDAEMQKQTPEWERAAHGIMKNATLQLTLETSSWNVCPTAFQRSSFPSHWQDSISVIHDGINTKLAAPNPSANTLILDKKVTLKPGEQIITFANRSLEPYRGCHTFIRSIPSIQKQCPSAKIVVVGKTTGVSYGASCEQGEWKERFLKEIEGHYDPSRVYFTGALPYQQFLHLLQLSQAHVYLTYPFVLSWSLLEAMSTECPIVGSNTAPVQEVIKHGKNGLLVDFFDHEALAESVTELLHNRELAITLGRKARTTILKNYSLEQCVPRHIQLMNLVASGVLSNR